ncbi:MAG: hypothetical protein JWP36_2318 [Paucimonas sp.]|nr:hypothetical protein [Paucimonas sp.]
MIDPLGEQRALERKREQERVRLRHRREDDGRKLTALAALRTRAAAQVPASVKSLLQARPALLPGPGLRGGSEPVEVVEPREAGLPDALARALCAKAVREGRITLPRLAVPAETPVTAAKAARALLDSRKRRETLGATLAAARAEAGKAASVRAAASRAAAKGRGQAQAESNRDRQEAEADHAVARDNDAFHQGAVTIRAASAANGHWMSLLWPDPAHLLQEGRESDLQHVIRQIRERVQGLVIGPNAGKPRVSRAEPVDCTGAVAGADSRTHASAAEKARRRGESSHKAVRAKHVAAASYQRATQAANSEQARHKQAQALESLARNAGRSSVAKPADEESVALPPGRLHYLVSFLAADARHDGRATQLRDALLALDQALQAERGQATARSGGNEATQAAIGKERTQSQDREDIDVAEAMEREEEQQWAHEFDQLADALSGELGPAQQQAALQASFGANAVPTPGSNIAPGSALQSSAVRTERKARQFQQLAAERFDAGRASEISDAIAAECKRMAQRNDEERRAQPDTRPDTREASTGTSDTVFHRQVQSL